MDFLTNYGSKKKIVIFSVQNVKNINSSLCVSNETLHTGIREPVIPPHIPSLYSRFYTEL